MFASAPRGCVCLLSPAQCMPGYTYPLPSACWDTPPPAQCMLGYGEQAVGTHPTGMHTCSQGILNCVGCHNRKNSDSPYNSLFE